jgi:hypothetical protein
MKACFGTALLGVIIAALFAAVPFWTYGLTLHQAAATSTVIFPLVLAAYAYVLRKG